MQTSSKFLSYILRHNPGEIGLHLDGNGWANVSELISKCNKEKDYSLDIHKLNDLVKNNDKQRFIFNKDKTKIRANQGHSIKIDLGLNPVKPPDLLYHGTAEKHYHNIRKNGILKMKRNHVHLSSTTKVAKEIGKRHGKPIILKINAKEMYQNDINFYLSENRVWLTFNISPQYISIL